MDRPKVTKTEEHIRAYYFDDDKYNKHPRSRKGLKKSHIIVVLVVLILGYILLRFFSQPPAKKLATNVGPGERVHSFDVKKFKPHTGLPIVDLKDFKRLEKYKDPEGCPSLENCDHVTCNDLTEDRVIKYSAKGCRQCVCVPAKTPRKKNA